MQHLLNGQSLGPVNIQMLASRHRQQVVAAGSWSRQCKLRQRGRQQCRARLTPAAASMTAGPGLQGS